LVNYCVVFSFCLSLFVQERSVFFRALRAACLGNATARGPHRLDLAANNALGHLWQRLSVGVLRLEAGDLEPLAALFGATDLLSVNRAKLGAAVFARLDRDPANLALGQRALVPLK
jgi:hypothetical protein